MIRLYPIEDPRPAKRSKLRILISDIVLGFYFGYSWCCIRNFMMLNYLSFSPARLMKNYLGTWDRIGYVRCLQCVSDGVNKKSKKRNVFRYPALLLVGQKILDDL